MPGDSIQVTGGNYISFSSFHLLPCGLKPSHLL